MSDQHPKVLLVDDEPRTVGALGRALKPFYKTYLAVSEERALEIIRSRRIHVIVSDQRLPRMMGVELLVKVKMISPNTTRILLIDYADLSVVMDSANQTEIFRYLKKPWRTSEIVFSSRVMNMRRQESRPCALSSRTSSSNCRDS